MLFNSLHFLAFFPAVCMIYFVIPSLRWRNVFLVCASYYFYMNWATTYALLIFGSTVLTYFTTLGIEKYRTRKKTILTISIVLNLGILFIFKYLNTISAIITSVMHWLQIDMEMPQFGFLLPVGISFYIFQAVGYSVDVYRGTISAERDFLNIALFLSFFPQLVAGPIERASNLMPQFRKMHRPRHNMVMAGIRLMIWGYFLKLAVADNCGEYVDVVYRNIDYHNGGTYMLAMILYLFQIYGDFCGYSLVAIGAARVMGFRMIENFRRPLLSTSITEFWRRWHMSLTGWFRDYVYIPMGGNRVGKKRRFYNILTTFTLSGIWHGATLNFWVWGCVQGLLINAEKALGIGKKQVKGFMRMLAVSATFLVCCFSFFIFRVQDFKTYPVIFKGIFTDFQMPFMHRRLFYIILSVVIMCLVEIYQEIMQHRVTRSKRIRRHPVMDLIIMTFLVLYILIIGKLSSASFIYFQF